MWKCATNQDSLLLATLQYMFLALDILPEDK